mmetsp:Transcript_54192/g.132483  ORF Transcript_54192/g.132483 Transcript_54192/m.132483 type:complete len:246 (-) Transcript_54192:602-1339(-)
MPVERNRNARGAGHVGWRRVQRCRCLTRLNGPPLPRSLCFRGPLGRRCAVSKILVDVASAPMTCAPWPQPSAEPLLLVQCYCRYVHPRKAAATAGLTLASGLTSCAEGRPILSLSSTVRASALSASALIPPARTTLMPSPPSAPKPERLATVSASSAMCSPARTSTASLVLQPPLAASNTHGARAAILSQSPVPLPPLPYAHPRRSATEVRLRCLRTRLFKSGAGVVDLPSSALVTAARAAKPMA